MGYCATNLIDFRNLTLMNKQCTNTDTWYPEARAGGCAGSISSQTLCENQAARRTT